MVTLSQAKTFGGIGSILVFIPFVSVAGFILLIIAGSGIADALQDRSIFRNTLGSEIAGIVGALLGAVMIVEVLSGLFTGTLVTSLMTLLLISWVCLLLSAIFLRRLNSAIASQLGVGIFKASAILYMIGAALTILLVGFFILFIAQILQAVAYFSIPDLPPSSSPSSSASSPPLYSQPTDWASPGSTTTPLSSPSSQPIGTPPGAPPQNVPTKFCTNCGSKIALSAVFCNQCGARQPYGGEIVRS
jgi:uncharacterized membrane protein